MQKINIRAMKVSLAVIGTVSLLVGCGSSDASNAPASDANSEETVRVGYFPITTTVQAIHAENEGMFEAAGIDVELVETGGGPEALSALISGSLDIVSSSHVPTFIAAQQGLPVRIISENVLAGDDQGLFVAPDSGIKEPADLVGKTVAVVNLQNNGTLGVYSMLEEDGYVPEDVDMVEIAPPEMPAALERGDVDAAWLTEPFQTLAEDAGMEKISNMFVGQLEGTPMGGWVTTEEFASENPEAVEAFQKSLENSTSDLEGHDEVIIETLPQFTEISEDIAAEIELAPLETELDMDRLDLLAKLMYDYGMINSELDVDSIVIE